MKIQTPILVLISLLLGASLANAKSQDAAYFATFTQPKVLNAVQPRVFENEVGKTVNVVVTVNEAGDPIEVIPGDKRASEKHALLTQRVIEAVAQWQFEPAKDAEGNHIPMTVKMPVRITNFSRN